LFTSLCKWSIYYVSLVYFKFNQNTLKSLLFCTWTIHHVWKLDFSWSRKENIYGYYTSKFDVIIVRIYLKLLLIWKNLDSDILQNQEMYWFSNKLVLFSVRMYLVTTFRLTEYSINLSALIFDCKFSLFDYFKHYFF